ncbi:hypothetical protein M885DRAFT_533072 [Pelagophyceae sp. CCMP2097]|nr:hypothetical protein M885DRAFT_533072 [Pelagophyceae sp. CCMP2097]
MLTLVLLLLPRACAAPGLAESAATVAPARRRYAAAEDGGGPRRTYIANASFYASAYAATLLGRPTYLDCEPPCFNPSVVEIPEDMLFGLPLGSKYLATHRVTRGEALCESLWEPTEATHSPESERRRLNHMSTDARRRLSHMSTYMIIYNSSFQRVAAIVDAAGFVTNLGMHDARLERHGGGLLIHGMVYQKGKATWHVSRLVIEGHNRIHANMTKLRLFDVSDNRIQDFGKNFGILWDGGADPFRVLLWLKAAPVTDVRRGLPLPQPSDSVSQAKDLFISGFPVHNNISPLRLYPRFPNLRLGISHTHSDDSLKAHSREHGATAHGNTYLHYFFVMCDSEPNDVIATSPPFCFPSSSNSKKCDAIQFVTSASRLNSKTMLLGYGINDCEGAVVELDLDDVLDFVGEPDEAKCKHG